MERETSPVVGFELGNFSAPNVTVIDREFLTSAKIFANFNEFS